MNQLHVLLKAGHTVESIQNLKHEFEREFRSQLHCEVVSEDEAYRRLISGSNLPDVCTVPYWYLSELVEANILEPLSVEEIETTHLSVANDALSVSGQQFAVPHTLVGGALFYRKDRLGILPDQTLESLDSFLLQLEEIVYSGESIGLRTSPHFSSAETYRGLMFALGVDLFRQGFSEEEDPVLYQMSKVIDLVSTQKTNISNCGYSAVGELFQSGQISLMFDTSAWATIFSKNPEFFELVEIEQIGIGPKAQFFYAEGLGVVSGSQNKALAMQFINWRQSDRVVSYEIGELNRLDFPRSDLHALDSFAAKTTLASGYRARYEVEKSWGIIDEIYPVRAAGYVSWATAFSNTLSEKLIQRRND